MRPVDELEQLFRSEGLRVTPQRRCVFGVLNAAEGHPTAEWVFERARSELPSISLRTVYQTLNDLEALGELSPLHLAGGPTRFDVNREPHHHLACDSCGAVIDLHADCARPELPADAAEGFAVSSAEVVFRGRCRACQAAPVPSRSA